MQPFLGELLMGGIRLRDVSGSFIDASAEDQVFWSGHFFIDRQQSTFVERGRPYLLMLRDGRHGHVIVTSFERTNGGAMRVAFEPIGS